METKLTSKENSEIARESYEKGQQLFSEENFQEAVDHLKKAAEINHAEALNSLGDCYKNGSGVAKNLQQALKYYRLAADQGSASALFTLGTCYQCGEGVDEDKGKAAEFFHSAADQGHAEAQYHLGIYYQYAEKNIGKAINYYQLAAHQGHVGAKNCLTSCYEPKPRRLRPRAKAAKPSPLATPPKTLQGVQPSQANLSLLKKPQVTPWHQTPNHITTLVKLADKLLKRYSDHALFSLGQSPAWMIKTAEEISKKTRKTDLNYPKRIFGYIPFSGRFALKEKDRLNPSDTGFGQQPFHIPQRPSAEQKYRILLTSLGFSPEKIVNRFKMDGIKTVLLEYVQKGESLASFLSIIYLWAREKERGKELEVELKKALTVCILKQNVCKLSYIALPNEAIYVPCDSFEVENEFIVAIANSEDEGEMSDRLVPVYNQYRFGIPPETLMPNNEAMRVQITEKIIREIKLFFPGKHEEIYQQGKKFYEERNYTKAVEFFSIAADEWQHPAAQRHLGYCYQDGTGVSQDSGKAVYYYQLAADQGDPMAQSRLGWCYRNALGVNQDLRKAAMWWKKAADQGGVTAQVNLGVCYAKGEGGVEQNLNEAAKYFRMAADGGSITAKYYLGCYYKQNSDVPNAIKFFKEAATEDPRAKAELENLVEQPRV